MLGLDRWLTTVTRGRSGLLCSCLYNWGPQACVTWGRQGGCISALSSEWSTWEAFPHSNLPREKRLDTSPPKLFGVDFFFSATFKFSLWSQTEEGNSPYPVSKINKWNVGGSLHITKTLCQRVLSPLVRVLPVPESPAHPRELTTWYCGGTDLSSSKRLNLLAFTNIFCTWRNWAQGGWLPQGHEHWGEMRWKLASSNSWLTGPSSYRTVR